MAAATRRQFLMIAMGSAGAGGLAALGLGDALKSDRPAPGTFESLAEEGLGLHKAQRASRAFGTAISITALHADQATARAALDAAFDEVEIVEQVMSLYRSDSQVRKLNRDGELADPHPYLMEALEAAGRMAARSEGAFDVTVQPLWEEYSAAMRGGTLPSAKDLDAARRKVDWSKVYIERGRVRLGMPGMALTLNGIAQGYATDRALGALRAHGVSHALLNTGEVGSLGHKDAQGRRPWRVGIQHPREKDALVALARLQGGCLATSGDYATTFTPDRANHHIFDPRTGRSPGAFSSVSIVAPKAMDADALSTAVFVAGLERGLELLKSTPGAEALFVRKDGTMLATKEFPTGESAGS